MNVTYSRAVAESGPDYELIEQATRFLERDILHKFAPKVSAAWDRLDAADGYPTYTLRLTDATGETTGRFTPVELRSDGKVELRLRFLWDDLLRISLHRYLDNLHEGEGDAA